MALVYLVFAALHLTTRCISVGVHLASLLPDRLLLRPARAHGHTLRSRPLQLLQYLSVLVLATALRHLKAHVVLVKHQALPSLEWAAGNASVPQSALGTTLACAGLPRHNYTFLALLMATYLSPRPKGALPRGQSEPRPRAKKTGRRCTAGLPPPLISIRSSLLR